MKILYDSVTDTLRFYALHSPLDVSTMRGEYDEAPAGDGSRVLTIERVRYYENGDTRMAAVDIFDASERADVRGLSLSGVSPFWRQNTEVQGVVHALRALLQRLGELPVTEAPHA